MANFVELTNRFLTIFVLNYFLSYCLYHAAYVPCWPKKFESDSIVCVCNSTYCDSIEANDGLAHGRYALYTSTRAGLRMVKSNGTFVPPHTSGSTSGLLLTVNPFEVYQTVLGFGGAMTDAAAINIHKLHPQARDYLLGSYFAPHGIEYSMIRVNMAGCDFSTRVYSYDDHRGDFNLTKFSLPEEDTTYKIPLIKQAQNLSKNHIRVFGSPWSAPAWMKTNDLMYGKGSLKGRPGGAYYKTWAKYFIRFLEEYSKRGVSLWGLTVLNEPLNGFIANFSFNCMGMSAQDERDFVVKHLGPALKASVFSDVKLMILDDQRFELPLWPEQVFTDPAAVEYVSGIAVHWYWDGVAPPKLLDVTHAKYPDKFILATEACSGSQFWETKVLLGSWSRAESYAHDIIEDLNHWVVGWTDWNIALDMTGGPNWAKNFVDSPVIVDAENGVFYKQPMFYALAHFSKFIRPGCKRIDVTASSATELEYTAFMCADNSLVVVLLNRLNRDIAVTIRDPMIGDLVLTMSHRSVSTVIWWR